ncbi:hypothetical protein ABE073_00295 [Lederbergia citrisecunda]|uniref:phage neck terminator protein n=1 Tax=Lederbergia citrisecunda TaxID=2833583 RepID=UPI003D2D4FA5
MLELNSIRTPLIKGIKAFTGNTVIMADQAGKPPNYPYYTLKIVTAGQTIVQSAEKVVGDQVILSQVTELVVSVTSFSDKLDQSFDDAYKALEWFKGAGMYYLQDHNITIVKTYPLDNRDTFLSVDYERRHGFDVRLRVRTQTAPQVGYIEYVDLEVD